jgi:acylphosphatase
MADEARRIVVQGRVQGVGFRFFVQDVALSLGLRGNVRNCPDRTVEIEVEGPPQSVAAFIEEVRRGPALSRVDRVDVQPTPAGQFRDSFLIEGY